MPGFISAVNTSITIPIGCTRLYYICFLNGFAISSVVFITLHRFFPAPMQKDFVDSPVDKRQVMREYQEKWDMTEVTVEQINVHGKDEEDVLEIPHMLGG